MGKGLFGRGKAVLIHLAQESVEDSQKGPRERALKRK